MGTDIGYLQIKIRELQEKNEELEKKIESSLFPFVLPIIILTCKDRLYAGCIVSGRPVIQFYGVKKEQKKKKWKARLAFIVFIRKHTLFVYTITYI